MPDFCARSLAALARPPPPSRLIHTRWTGKVVIPPAVATVCYHKGTQTDSAELGFEGGGLTLGPEALAMPERSPPPSATRRRASMLSGTSR